MSLYYIGGVCIHKKWNHHRINSQFDAFDGSIERGKGRLNIGKVGLDKLCKLWIPLNLRVTLPQDLGIDTLQPRFGSSNRSLPGIQLILESI